MFINFRVFFFLMYNSHVFMLFKAWCLEFVLGDEVLITAKYGIGFNPA